MAPSIVPPRLFSITRTRRGMTTVSDRLRNRKRLAVGVMALCWSLGSWAATADAAGPVPSSNPLSGDPEAIEAGRKLYGTWCSQCHGGKADGVSRFGKYAADLRKVHLGYT